MGWIKGKVKKFDLTKLNFVPKIPHLGWNSINPTTSSALFKGVDFEKGFYFIHSYYFECQNEENVLSTTNYGSNFASSVNFGNIYGTQFHPEKSHKNGINLLENFYNL